MVNLDYLYNPEIAKPYFERNRFIDKKLGFQVIENGMIVPRYIAANGASIPNGIVDSNGKLVKSSCFLYGLGRDYTPPQNQFNTARKLSFMSECFISVTVMS